MEKKVFDSKMITTTFRAGSYDVYYVLYYDSKPTHKSSIYIPEDPVEEFKVKRNNNSACFAGMRNMLGAYLGNDPYCKETKHDVPVPNRVYYKMNFSNAGKPILKKSERYAWLKLCKEHNLLPNYVVPSTVITGKVVFDMTETSPSLLYTYLTMMRTIVEYPAFVRSMVYLVDKLEMNFWAAFVYTSKFYISNHGHHIVAPGYTGGYYCAEKSQHQLINMTGIDLSLMISLRRFYKNPTKFDNRHITELCKTHWQCNDIIQAICKIKCTLKASDLFKPSIGKLVETDTDDEAKKQIDVLLADSPVEIVIKEIGIETKKEVGGKNGPT